MGRDEHERAALIRQLDVVRESGFSASQHPSVDREDQRATGRALFLAGTAVSPAGAGTDGSGSGFFQAMSENRVRMRRGPTVGQHLFQVWGVRVQAE